MKKNSPYSPKNLLVVLGILLLIQVIKPISALAQPMPSTDINTYVLFAKVHLNFKGNNNVNHPGWGSIKGGNAGVNDCRIGSDNTLVFGSTVTMDNGTEVVGDKVQIDNPSNFHTTIWQLFANAETVGFDPSVLVGDPTVEPWTCPLLVTLPTCPIIPDLSGAQVITVDVNGTRTLAPGDYGDVTVKDNGTLILSDGVYRFNSFNATGFSGSSIKVVTTDGVIVEVAGAMLLNNNAIVGPSNLAQFYVCGNPVNDNAMKFSQNTEFHGQVVVPNGTLNLGNTTILTGRFWANYLASDFNDSITYHLPCLPTTTPASRCDTGVVTLSAAGCANSCTALNWYTTFTGGVAIAHGSTYSPHLTQTTTFYVSCTGLDGVETPRVPVTGTILPGVQISISTLTCDPGNCSGAINLTVTKGFPPVVVNSGLTFSWTGPNNFSRSTQNITGLCGSSIAPYCVTVTTTDGCSATLCTPVLPCAPPPCLNSTSILHSINNYVLFAYYFLQFKGGNQSAGWGHIDGNIGVNFPLNTSISDHSLNFGTSGFAYMADGTQAVADNVRGDATGSFYDLYDNSENTSFAATIRGTHHTPVTLPIIAVLPTLTFTPCRPATAAAPAVTVGGNTGLASPHTFNPGTYGNMRINDNSVVTFLAGTYDINDVSIGKNVTIIVDNATVLNIDYSFISNDNLKFGDAAHSGAHINVGACGINPKTTRSGSFSKNAIIYGHYFSPGGFLDFGGGNNLFGTFWAYILSGDPNDNFYCVNSSTGARGEDMTDEVSKTNNDMLSVYPNPFGDQSTIEFTSSKDMHGTLEVFNLVGMKVAEIYNGEFVANQKYAYSFDASNLAPGMYIVRLNSTEGVYTKSMIKIK